MEKGEAPQCPPPLRVPFKVNPGIMELVPRLRGDDVWMSDNLIT